MAILEGRSGTVLGVGEEAASPLHVTGKPLVWHGNQTIARRIGISGAINAAVVVPQDIFAFRWEPRYTGNRYAVIHRVSITANVNATFFAAGVPLQIDLVKCIAWTVGHTGGSGPTLTNNNRMHDEMHQADENAAANSQAMIRNTNGALLVVPGTRTVDSVLSTVLAYCPQTGELDGHIMPEVVLLDDGEGDHPLVLDEQEGFAVRVVDRPLTGVWQYTAQIEWSSVRDY